MRQEHKTRIKNHTLHSKAQYYARVPPSQKQVAPWLKRPTREPFQGLLYCFRGSTGLKIFDMRCFLITIIIESTQRRLRHTMTKAVMSAQCGTRVFLTLTFATKYLIVIWGFTDAEDVYSLWISLNP